MTVSEASEILEFVLQNAEFTDAILFSTDAVPELTEEESTAVNSVLDHVRASYIGLLMACRDALLAQAGADVGIMASTGNRPDTIWERGMVQVPLIIRKSWVAWVSFGLWTNAEEAPSRVRLFADVTTQKRHRPALLKVLAGLGVAPKMVRSAHRLMAPPIARGSRFADVASQFAVEVWPIAKALRTKLESGPAEEEEEDSTE